MLPTDMEVTDAEVSDCADISPNDTVVNTNNVGSIAEEIPVKKEHPFAREDSTGIEADA